MYASFIETDGKDYVLVAPSRHRAGARETAIWLSGRVKSLAYCEFIEDEFDLANFISVYGAEEAEVERIGF
jgi:hypothetical protein